MTLVLALVAFYSGAHGVLRVLTHIKKLDDYFGQFLVRVTPRAAVRP